VLVIEGDENKVSIKKLLEELYKRETVSILVEGGGKTIGSFVDNRLVDKIYAFHAPILIGGNDAVSAVRGEGAKTIQDAMKLRRITFKRFGDTMLTIGYRE
ncbi:dihydrofolate reductase family protein, partial [Candidatus Gottesmanbacteria bacterium]|nr:dihydrofolate reductase family protein [Candidatus Gottesmanbacteria bacterium]